MRDTDISGRTTEGTAGTTGTTGAGTSRTAGPAETDGMSRAAGTGAPDVDRALQRVEQHRSDHGTQHTAGYERGDRLLPPDRSDDLSLRLREAVGGFVDDPRAAVEEADRVLEEVGTRLTDVLNRHRGSLRQAWQGTETGTGTGAGARTETRSGSDRSAGSSATSPDHAAATAYGAADTERLRRTLQDYRELAERLLSV